MTITRTPDELIPSRSDLEAVGRVARDLRELGERCAARDPNALAQLSSLFSSPEMDLALKLLEAVAEGRNIAVHREDDEELTTSQAAELLGMSRPKLVDLLEQGEIPYRMVGTHRRVRRSEVLAYRKRTERRGSAAGTRPRADRLRGLQEMAEFTESLGLGY